MSLSCRLATGLGLSEQREGCVIYGKSVVSDLFCDVERALVGAVFVFLFDDVRPEEAPTPGKEDGCIYNTQLLLGS